MKRITSFFIVLFSVTSMLFAQTKPTYCDSVFLDYGFTVSGNVVSFSPKVTTTTKPAPTIIAQQWNYGDGTSGTTFDGSHTYTTAGTYKPCMTVKFKNPRETNGYCVKEICHEVTTTGSDPCADFKPTAGGTLGSDGKTITYEASSSNSTNNTYTYSWDFGDNTKGDGRTGTHAYSAGTWRPCVTITSSNPKCTKTICFEITVKESDPCANFNPAMGITVGTDGVATFEASVGTNYTYSWDFGDGTTGSDRTGKHTYKPGTYRPCVTVYDPATKCKKTVCKEITITEKDPCADFNPTFSYKIGENGYVYFSGSSEAYTYTWSYGDGTAGTGNTSTHTYKPGTYKPCVTVYDAKTGCKKIICQEITITGTNTDPCKDFNPDFSYKIDGNVVVFEGQGTSYTYKWSLNGIYKTDRTFKYDFSKPGTYKVCVTITDPKTKCSKTVCKEIVIKGKETTDPCKDFNPKVSFQTDGLTIKLDVDGGKGSTMEWNFGDGSSSKDRTVKHTYTKAGKYTICVTVYDAKRQCKKTICFTIEVQGKTTDPCADFNPDFSFTVTGNKIVVEGKNMTGVEYGWSWGDKLGDKGRVADHTYKVGGKYYICMTAYDPKTKCTKTVCKTIEIGGTKLIAPPKEGKEALMVFPNPADTKISVVTSSNSDAKILVKTAYGAEVLRYDATPNENKSIDLIIESLPKGTYYINVEQDGKVETTKFVK